MITVIIPAYNEQDTIGKVVTFCLKESLVTEVIVVDDQSTDDTLDKASKAGAMVIKSRKQGKGISMREGILASSNQYLVFLDADIYAYPADTIRKMMRPIMDNECDFVKGAFFRNAGKVTELVAKPLLKIFYPELASFRQPLSSMIAGKKSFLRKIEFQENYGVDIGILIDMYLMKARVKEVNIGYIENKGKTWQTIGTMSTEISNTILQRAKAHHPQKHNLEHLGAVQVIAKNLDAVIKAEIGSLRKLYVFDLENTLVQGRFIDECARKHSFEKELNKLRRTEKDPTALAKRTALLMKGLSVAELKDVANAMPLMPGAKELFAMLRKQGNVAGIISDNYLVVAEYFKEKLNADFAVASQLNFFEGKATGEVNIPSWFYYKLESICQHTWCKTNALMHVAHRYDIPIENCICIGSGPEDVCMIQKAGMGIAFCTKSRQLKNAADLVIEQCSYAEFAGIDSMMPRHKKQEIATHGFGA